MKFLVTHGLLIRVEDVRGFLQKKIAVSQDSFSQFCVGTYARKKLVQNHSM